MTQSENKTIMITGAASGIGAALAKNCVAKGFNTILLDKQLKKLETLYDEIEADTPELAAIYPMDVKGASVNDYLELASVIAQNYGKLDALIHCAATHGQVAPTGLQDNKTWLETLHINLTAAFFLTQSCLPLLRKGEKSYLLFSSDERKNNAYMGAYGIAKAGIEAMAAQLTAELESEGIVETHIITPPDTNTPLFIGAFPAINPTTVQSAEVSAQLYLDKLIF